MSVSNVITIGSIDDPVFRNVADMEDDLEAIKNFATTVMLLSDDPDVGTHPGVLSQIAREITRHADALYARREELWKLNASKLRKTRTRKMAR